VGSKYVPSIKDLKAARRFQQNSRRAEANGPVRKSMFITAEPPKRAPTPDKTPVASPDVQKVSPPKKKKG
jgi:hypothetical protein